MRYIRAFVVALILTMGVAGASAASISPEKADAFAGQDLHLVSKSLISYQLSTGEQALVFTEPLVMSIGANRLESDQAVVWLETVQTGTRGRVRTEYNATVYLQGNVSVKKAGTAKTTDISENLLEGGQALLVRFAVSGEVFVTAEKRERRDPHLMELYRTALSYARTIEAGPNFVVQAGAVVPELPAEKVPEQKVVTEEGKPAVAEVKEPGLLEHIFEPQEKKPEPEPKKPRFAYPIVFGPVGPEKLKFDLVPAPDGTNVVTIRQRFYVSQRQDEQGRLLELQADNAVVFYSGREKEEKKEGTGLDDFLAGTSVEAIYLSGDVVMAEGQRVIRADEVFYDFPGKKAVAINAVMRNFDSRRQIPIYVRAAKIRQLAANKFSGENVTVTTSEFYLPQLSANASSVVITDMTTVDEQLGQLTDRSYDAEMRDVRFKLGRRTILRLPYLRGNLQRPDVPLESVHTGYDSTWGASVETRWYLARILGLREPVGTDSRLLLDYYGKRGVGAGAEVEYVRDEYFGKIFGYIINDHGQDRLGRLESRKDLEPPRELRGRFSWEHRHFLPYDWQLTTGVDYSSDEHFVEQYNRDEFNTRRHETYIHLKQSRDNWAFALLGKGRINDFEEALEELPSGEFHLTGQSLFDDKTTFYSDTQVGRMRQRIGNDHVIPMSERMFTFLSHRSELDFPMWLKPFKLVPYVAGWLGYDDRSGFTRTLVDGTNSGRAGDNEIWIAETGLRAATQLWKVYPQVKSRLWDLNGLRHIIEPQATAVMFEESDLNVRQKDALHLGLSQRLQTKRGPEDDRRMVDWMRLDLEGTWVNRNDDVSDAGPGPDRFVWNKPIVPLRVLSAPEIFNGDLVAPLPTFEMYGPRRDYVGADYVWRVSDTTAVLSDTNYDIRSGVVQQLDIGFSRLVWPDLAYYVGNRYLRRVQIRDEKGSNAFTFAATYVMDPRYSLVVGQQYDFDYGANVRSDITLIRRYHRICWGLTYSADQSVDRQAVVLSMWPQGIPELALGHRRYAELSIPEGY